MIVFVALYGDAHAVPREAERAPAFSDVGLADAVEDEDEEALEGVEDDEEDVEGEVDAVDGREVSDDPSWSEQEQDANGVLKPSHDLKYAKL